jgi:branched-chain amino acid transport system substrate-binding protein
LQASAARGKDLGMSIKCWSLPVCVLGLVAFTLGGCKKPDSAGGDGDAIIVGEYASLTGKEAAFGRSSHRGTELAVEEINKAGGVLGKQIKLVTEDTQSKEGESSTVVSKLISRDRAVAILGEVASGRSLEAGPICQQNKVPMISPSSTNPKVTQVGDYIFRVCFLDSFQGDVLARFGLTKLNAKRIAIMSDVSQSYSVGLAEHFRESFIPRGGQIVSDQKFSSGDTDFNAQLTAVKAANPEAIFVPCYYQEAGLIVRQARQLGIRVPLFGGDGWEAPELLEIGKEALEGCYYSTHFSPQADTPEAKKFVQAYQAKYSEVPDAMAALGYDSAMILADAIKRAGGTAAQGLRDALAGTKEYQGVTGRTTIDANRDASKPATIVTIKDGKFQYVETMSAE